MIYEPHLEQLININPLNVVNPDQDIAAPGVPIIRITQDRQLTQKKQIARVYSAPGKASGTLNIERLTLLHKAFNYTKQHNPEAHSRHNNPTFEQAVLKLLNRHKDGHKLKETGNAHEWSTPNEFMKAMAEGLSLTTDRFASPVNFSPYLEKYYSKYEQDQLFGANCDEYSKRRTGASLATSETGAAQADNGVI